MNANKRLERTNNRWIAGVCGGIAEFFGFNYDALRIVWLLLTICTAAFPGTLLYLCLWILMPKSND